MPHLYIYTRIQPATVSRCGMVYLEPSSLGWRPLLQSWLTVLPPGLHDHQVLILALVDWLVEPCLQLVFSKLKELVPTSESNLTCSLMYLFEMLMTDALKEERTAKESRYMQSWIVVRYLIAHVIVSINLE